MAKYTVHHVIVFVLTFMGYAFFHATRKSFSNVKETITEQWTPTPPPVNSSNSTEPDHIWNSHELFKDGKKAEVFLGMLDTSFMVAYAFGLYLSGIVGDRFDMRKVLAFGMCSSAVCVFFFGCVSEWLHLYSIPYYLVFWIANGLLQSLGWPAMVAVMGNWFGKSSRGLVLGMWSACASVGNIIGAFMASSMLEYGYEYAFLLPASVLFCWGIVTFCALIPTPKEIGLPEPSEIPSGGLVTPRRQIQTEDNEPLLEDNGEAEPQYPHSAQRGQRSPSKKKAEPLGFFRSLILPGVIMYSLAYACLKFVNYAFFFWLPFYLTSAYKWDQAEADRISIWYDVGGIVLGAIAGFVSDRLNMRGVVVVALLLGALPALYGYSVSPNDHVINAVLMAVVGAFIGAPANLISSAISADLGRQGQLKGNKKSLATVTGIIDGTGSLGAAIGQVLVPVIQLKLGWHWVFYMFLIMTSLSILCLIPVVVREVRDKVVQRRGYKRVTARGLAHGGDHE